MVTPTYVAGVAGCCLHSERGKSETYRCGIILFWLRGLHGVPVSNMEVLLFNGILMGRCLPRYSYYCAISRANAFRDWGRIKIRPLLKSPLRIIQRNLASFSYLFFHRFSPFFLFFKVSPELSKEFRISLLWKEFRERSFQKGNRFDFRVA